MTDLQDFVPPLPVERSDIDIKLDWLVEQRKLSKEEEPYPYAFAYFFGLMCVLGLVCAGGIVYHECITASKERKLRAQEQTWSDKLQLINEHVTKVLLIEAEAREARDEATLLLRAARNLAQDDIRIINRRIEMPVLLDARGELLNRIVQRPIPEPAPPPQQPD